MTEEQMWDAIVNKDQSGVEFYYAVASTGVFCRPSCGARLPRRSNVSFYRSCEAAIRAGFRPCRRCRPGEVDTPELQARNIQAACELLQNSDAFPGLQSLAATAGMSRFRFAHVFREITGVAPRAYFQMLRGQRIRKELNRPGRVTDSIFDAGYGSSGSFYAQSNSLLGMTPGLYRRKGKGLTLRYAAGVCRFGSLLVAGSEKGICSIALGDNVESLLADLRKEFADAQIVEGDAELAAYIAQIAAYAEQPRKALHLPLDIQGTAFQRRVWELLQMVPVGETATYSQIAQRLGKPGAVRAVARACATNRIALAVPCHRIVRNDGTPSGYRWGLERKTALLAHERDH